MRKFLFFCGLVVFMTVLLTMPAAAMCDECVNSGDQITENHCETRCTCEYEECWACGDYSNLVYCDNEHESNTAYSKPSCSGSMQCYSAECKHCGEDFSYCLYPKPHQYVSFSTSATCTLKGESGQKCSTCGTKRNVTTSPALGHDYKLKQVSASCDTDGYNYQECSRCNDSYRTTTIPATGHTWKETSRDPASCQETGKIYLECSSCGETSAETIDIIPHDYKTTIVEPTCQGAGYSYHECTMCGHNYNSASKPQLPHTFVEKSREPATCDSPGKIYLECSCGETSIEIIDQLDHNYQGGKCTECGASDPNYVPPHTHSYTSSVTAPTCTDEGYTTYTCNCGDSYTSDRKNPTGHSYVLGVCRKCGADDPDYEPPCDHDYEDGECTKCGASDPDYEPPCNHDYQPSVTPPTCTDEGYTTHTCSKCGDSYTSDRKNPTGHSYEDGECTECGASDPDYTSPHTHNYSSAVTPPTCTAEGFTVYTCACGHSYKSHYTEVIPHNYVDGLCSMCDKVDPSLNPPHGHTYATVVTAPTCHSKGFTTYTCSCGNTYVDNYVDEIPHQFVQQEKVEPKCGVEGHIYSVCNYNCGEEKYEPIAALIHNWSIIGTEVFEDGTGIATYECTRCEERKTETVYSEATLAENWLLTAIRGFADAFIDIYQTVANGFQIGGITLGQVISGALIVVVLLLLMAFALKILG